MSLLPLKPDDPRFVRELGNRRRRFGTLRQTKLTHPEGEFALPAIAAQIWLAKTDRPASLSRRRISASPGPLASTVSERRASLSCRNRLVLVLR
jgi:hypothetical protein